MEGTPFGRYRLVELLGHGGMGEVWRAYDTATNNRAVAIKLLPPQLASDSTFVRRFRREADAAAQLNNPHIIPIHNYGEIDGRLYVDMRLVEGRDLQAVLADGPLEPARAVRIIEQVAKALQAAHKIGLVHRDVKPSNILLDDDDFAYLIDFGIARGADETRLTATGAMIGSWHYMAPERLRAHAADARADIYALACVLYECLTGHRPFPGDSVESQVAAHLTDPPPQPSVTQPTVPAQFDAVIAKGMAKDPDERYATTVELARAARDATTVPIPQPVPQPAAPESRPHAPPAFADAAETQPPPSIPPSVPTQHAPAQDSTQWQQPEAAWAPAYQREQHAPPPAGAIPYPPTPPPAVRVPSPRPRWRSRVVWSVRIVVGLIALYMGPVVTVVLTFSPGKTVSAGPDLILLSIVQLVSWAVALYVAASVALALERRRAASQGRDVRRRAVLILTALGAIVAVVAVLIMLTALLSRSHHVIVSPTPTTTPTRTPTTTPSVDPGSRLLTLVPADATATITHTEQKHGAGKFAYLTVRLTAAADVSRRPRR